MLARVQAGALEGVHGRPVSVECDIANSLPGFVVVGLADKSVDEAKERVRAALKHAQLSLPPKRIIMNLAPGDLPKDGTGYDLALAIALLAASGQLKAPDDALFAGELGLDGGLRPVPGALSYARLTAEMGLKRLFISAENAAEAALIDSIAVYPVKNLFELYRHLLGESEILVQPPTMPPTTFAESEVNLANVYGQDEAKRALEITHS